MDQFIVSGGRPLRGRVRVSGSKNAALPILISTLLTDVPCVIDNVPDLRDIHTTLRLIEQLGKRVEWIGSTVRVRVARPLGTAAPYDLVKQMRASILVAGPLLARRRRARVALPGGCAIGLRPIDIHLAGFRRMGVGVSFSHGDVVLRTRRLRPADIRLRFPSVGATENLMMAAAGIPGTTVIRNAAREPEIVDLARFLESLGACVIGAGGAVVRVDGAARLGGARHSVIADRIETGTLLIACLAAGGNIRVEGAGGEHLRAVLDALARAGAKVREEDGGIRITAAGRPRPVSIRTRPYPGFPTDLQAPWMAAMSVGRGRSRIREEIFEKRFLHAAELGRMGAWIRTDGEIADLEGVPRLHGAPVMASDIRAGAALLVAAVAARGRSEIHRVYHIDRGYERVEVKLRALGVRIRRVNPEKSSARAQLPS
ncbi:MAG: UDP-N-acetylglucosamine 1-carboxyvinyltransferase [Elusimicrobia bacterium]|nr:UDP-N-acetylglucosamine 1-carboxyvinyltransferase [Elusimicrobiota bacterium]